MKKPFVSIYHGLGGINVAPSKVLKNGYFFHMSMNLMEMDIANFLGVFWALTRPPRADRWSDRAKLFFAICVW